LVDYFDGLACQWSKKYAEGGSMRHRIEAIPGPYGRASAGALGYWILVVAAAI